MKDPEGRERRLARHALGRYAEPSEIALAFVFLASDDSNHISGQALCVEGGLVI